MTRSLLDHKFIRFCFVGAISSLIDVSMLFILVEYVKLPILVASSFALMIGSINGYILNKKLTFKDTSTSTARQYIHYLFVSIIGLVLTLILMRLFVEALSLYYLFAKAITILLVTVWNFTINLLFVFKK